MKILLVVLLAGAAVAAGEYFARAPATDGSAARPGGAHSGAPTPDSLAASGYRYAKVSRGDVVQQVRAAGRVDAVVAVQVSSQLSGQVADVFVDFNDRVKRGQALARLDDKILRAKLREGAARNANARASFEAARAEALGAVARYEEASKDLERRTALSARGAASQRDVEAARARMLSARSALDAARAIQEVRRTEIEVADALMQQVQIDLDRTVIRAPIDGIVIERSVDPGQTVAASLQAPVLFLIAQDLRQMEVKAFIDEADIGRIRPGQDAVFRVDAYPHERFHGRVRLIRRSPRVVENVTTYTVVVTAANPRELLLPGMTADIRLITAARRNVLRVPIAALRFLPKSADIDTAGGAASRSDARVWRPTGHRKLRPAPVKIGAVSEVYAEIVSDAFKPGDLVVVGYAGGR